MKKKILVVFILTLLIAMTILPVSGIKNADKNEGGEQILSIEQEISPSTGDDVDWRHHYQYDLQNFRYSRDRKGDFKSNCHPRELIVKFKEEINEYVSIDGILNTDLESINRLNAEFGIISAEKFFGDNPPSSLSNIFKFILSDDLSIIEISEEYKKDQNIIYAEPNYILQISAISNPLKSKIKGLVSTRLISGYPRLIPDDPYFDQQWALDQPNDCDIDAPEVWDIETGSENIIIAIPDSGVDYSHNDLADNIWINEDEIPDNGIDDDGNGFIDDINGWDFHQDDNDPMDRNGHGTICAGVVGAVTNNAMGIAGVCWNCTIMPIRIGHTGAPITNVVKGLLYATNNNANIICMSWGSHTPSNLEKDTLDYVSSQGVVLVASAGDDDTHGRYYPAAFDNVIAVAATDQNDSRFYDSYFWWGSNYGKWVDVSAPGKDILTLRANGTDYYGDGEHIVDEEYYIADGTFLSCPYVVGLAALLLSKNYECPYPIQMVKSMISYTTDEIETDEYIGTGRINAFKALTQEPFAVDLEFIPNWEDAKGIIDINGAAWGEDFQYFVLENGLGENPSSWNELLYSLTPQNDTLLLLDTTMLEEGLHTIRLKVVCDHGEYIDTITLYINNEADGTYDADIFISNCFDSSTPGWGVTHFDRIQDGISKAKNGDTVFVYDGIYHGYINISNSLKLSLIGQNKNWTIIDGGIVINFCRKITVSGFTVRQSIPPTRWDLIAITLCSKCNISGNRILNDLNVDHCGIYLDRSFNNIVSKNDFIDRGTDMDGTAINIGFSMYNSIFENTITGHNIGIASAVANRNTISNNIFLKNSGGLLFAIFSNRNIISDNIFENNHDGIEFDLVCNGNRILKNSFYNNTVNGIVLWSASSNKIIANDFVNNGWTGFVIDGNSFNNQIYFNNFIGNGLNSPYDPYNAKDYALNLWYKPILRKGNYWDDYTGVDNNGDGIGDTPYNIPPNDLVNKDRFPLMEPVDIENVTGIYDLY